MNELFVWREKLQECYANWSIYIDKAIQFVLGFAAFFIINQNIGLMKAAASPVVTLALAVICTFLPPVFTAFAATLLVLAHLFKLSLGVMGAAALIFLMMFIFYGRFTPKRALILLITPIAFLLHIPYVVPVACALVMGPVVSIPIVFGTIAYYMIACVKNSATAITSTKGIMPQITLFIKTVFQDKSLWITAVAFIICVFVVYVVRRMAIDHAWKIAAAAGAVVNIIVIVAGDMAFNVHTSYGMLILGNLAAIVAGLIMEFFLFSVDYTRTEQLQFEDDEYYYYVKAIPKISVTAPKKTVKRINERRDAEEFEDDEIKPRPRKKQDNRRAQDNRRPQRTASEGQARKRSPQPKKAKLQGNTEELLLARSLRDELDIQNIVEKELEEH